MSTLLEYLENRIKLSGNETITFDELAEWPKEELGDAISKGKLVQADDADGIICRQCPQDCYKEVETRIKDGCPVGVFYCADEDCAGLITVEMERLQQWEIIGEKKPAKTELTEIKPQKVLPLNIRVANVLIKHQRADSAEIAKMVDSTPGSVRTTDAWKMREELQNKYDIKTGWKDAEGNMDTNGTYDIKPEHYDIYGMFQDYKSGKSSDYPNNKRISERLVVTLEIAKTLLREAKSIFDFEADKLS